MSLLKKLSFDSGQFTSSNVGHLSFESALSTSTTSNDAFMELKALYNSFLGVGPKLILKNSRQELVDSKPIRLTFEELNSSTPLLAYVMSREVIGTCTRPNQANENSTFDSLNDQLLFLECQRH